MIEESINRPTRNWLTLYSTKLLPPLAIDQPEDDLDKQIIVEFVNKIWRTKSRRQYIFPGHNASSVVNGDAELVVCLVYRIATDH